MTNVEWARRLGVGPKTIGLMGGAKRLEAMTELGLEIYLLVWLRGPRTEAVRAAVSRIGEENRGRPRKPVRREPPAPIEFTMWMIGRVC